jgi:sigma-B regulation protein RsbU (phosphoserine phosphatase)
MDRAFRHEFPYLFAGAAFVAVDMIAGALAVLRRKHEALLLYFALFASLYGLRVWLQLDLVSFTLNKSALLLRFHSVVNYLMPVPALFFLSSAGLLRRFAKIALYGYAAIGIVLVLAVCVWGPSPRYDLTNQTAAAITLLILGAGLLRRSSPIGSDLVAIRRGLLIAIVFALFDNLCRTMSFDWPTIEPLGVAVFLATLGYVTARRILEKDQQLNDIQCELEVAKHIQTSILPLNFPASDHFQVAARYAPMASVAGDFYDYIFTEPGCAGLFIADVSGHGVPAALIASMVKLAAVFQRVDARHPAKFLSGMNATLCGNTREQFVTAAYVYLDSEAGCLRYAGAAHPPMLLLRGDITQEVEENGLMLGLFESAEYSEVSYPLAAGDRLLLYTDGIIEAANASGVAFGMERLAGLFRETASLSADQVADKIMKSARAWSVLQEDDLTVIVCDFAAMLNSPEEHKRPMPVVGDMEVGKRSRFTGAFRKV